MELRAGRWLITGVAGFIGSHLLERLLNLGYVVVGIDNFSTRSMVNLESVRSLVGEKAWRNFTLHEGDVTKISSEFCNLGTFDFVLHQAALCSVPESAQEPGRYFTNNLLSNIQLLEGLKQGWCERLVYASSSAVYGEGDLNGNIESQDLFPLSPYGETKRTAELLAKQYSMAHELEWIGLRYFNVFGTRQNYSGPYSSVIQVWLNALRNDRPCQIYGDGSAVRDFVPVDRVVDYNLLAAAGLPKFATNRVFNVATGKGITILQLFELFKSIIENKLQRKIQDPEFFSARPGDIQVSIGRMDLATNYFPLMKPIDFRSALADMIYKLYE